VEVNQREEIWEAQNEISRMSVEIFAKAENE
jgi:hypothetical protein